MAHVIIRIDLNLIFIFDKFLEIVSFVNFLNLKNITFTFGKNEKKRKC